MLDLYSLIIGHKFCILVDLVYKINYNIAKGILKFCDKLRVFGQKVNTQQQNKNSNIKTLAEAGN